MIGDRYMVEPGDCLWGIAQEKFGDGSHWVRIWRYNNRREVVGLTGKGIPNPDLITPGQVLLIPRLPMESRLVMAKGSRPQVKPVSSQGKEARAGGSLASSSVKGSLSAPLLTAKSPISIKYNLGDMKFPPIVQPGMIMEIKMSGSIVVMSKKKYPAAYLTNRRELEVQAVQQANQAFASLSSDTRLIYDEGMKKLTYRSMLVTKSHQANSWASAVGVQMDSSNPLPKLRFEFRAPSLLSGTLPQHTYQALGVTIVIEVTPKPDGGGSHKAAPGAKPAVVPEKSTNWGKVTGVGLMTLAGVVVVGTIVEDFLTAGVGVADDAPSFALASGLFASGLAMICSNTSQFPTASVPAKVNMRVAMTASGSGMTGRAGL